ncbi:unnamed protein product [Clonostachys byssicola]|uniref:Uncharacterized protein n=1 Tax=Clonostachys byssicola TaxID=160290 RepID=A0A9N9UTE0_9HYPO|nr:unnamed protein product [Clonostachys byssicola]
MEHLPQKNLRSNQQVWPKKSPSGSDGLFPVWTAAKHYGSLQSIEHLFIEASKGFSDVEQQRDCLTDDGNVLVAAYYDFMAEWVYFSTILRIDYLNTIMRTSGADEV